MQSTFLSPTYEISYRFRRILVPVDGSENSLRALDVAIDFAKRYGSRITVLVAFYSGQKDFVEKALLRAKARSENKGIPIELKSEEVDPKTSSISNTIINEIIRGSYDLVVMGARGNTISEDIHIGSVAAAVIMNSPVSVLIIR